jgi:hypothetical protein
MVETSPLNSAATAANLFAGQRPAPPQPEQLILEWQAPSRPFRKRNRQYYVTSGMIVFLLVLILLALNQFLPIAVVFGISFFAYVLSAVPPEMVNNQITTYGIHTDQNFYYWEEMGRFWFETAAKHRLLRIEVNRFPNQLTLLLGELTEEDLSEILSQVLLQEQPPKTPIEKAAKWLQDVIPLDVET